MLSLRYVPPTLSTLVVSLLFSMAIGFQLGNAVQRMLDQRLLDVRHDHARTDLGERQ